MSPVAWGIAGWLVFLGVVVLLWWLLCEVQAWRSRRRSRRRRGWVDYSGRPRL